MHYIFSTDGAFDDQLALILLLTYRINITAIILTPADSYLSPALDTISRILTTTNNTHIPIIINEQPTINNFPEEWRAASIADNNRIKTITTPPKDITIHYTIMALQTLLTQPVIFIETGPLTALSHVLRLFPRAVGKIIWTGGSFDHDPMDQVTQKSDGLASWNAFCDPPAAEYVFNAKLPMAMCTRELTNKLTLTDVMYKNANTLHGRLFGLLSESYQIENYFPWDVFTVTYAMHPELFSARETSCEVITTGKSQGRTIETNTNNTNNTNNNNGTIITAVIAPINLPAIYNIINRQLSQPHEITRAIPI